MRKTSEGHPIRIAGVAAAQPKARAQPQLFPAAPAGHREAEGSSGRASPGALRWATARLPASRARPERGPGGPGRAPCVSQKAHAVAYAFTSRPEGPARATGPHVGAGCRTSQVASPPPPNAGGNQVPGPLRAQGLRKPGRWAVTNGAVLTRRAAPGRGLHWGHRHALGLLPALASRPGFRPAWPREACMGVATASWPRCPAGASRRNVASQAEGGGG